MVCNEKSAMFCQVLPVQGDLEKDEDIKALLEATIKQFGKLDILVRTMLLLLMVQTQPFKQLSFQCYNFCISNFTQNIQLNLM